MSYVKLTNYAIKDALLTGDPNKIVKGADIDAEFNAIATASAVTDAAYAAADAVVTNAYIAADVVVAATVAAKLDTSVAATTYAPLNSPALVGVPTAPTATVGTNTTQIATMAALLNQAFTTGFPSQAGNAGKFITTNGTSVSWAQVLPNYTGNALKVLRVNSGETDTEWATPEPVGLKLLATLTPTAAANVDALTVFTSTYDNYLIIGTGLNVGSSSTALYARLANSGTVDSSSVYVNIAFSSSASTATTQFIMGSFDSAYSGGNFEIHLRNVNATTTKSGRVFREARVAPVSIYNGTGQSLIYDSTSTVSGIRFYWAGGQNFAVQGTIRIYGYQN